jgi:hypothetical protein
MPFMSVYIGGGTRNATRVGLLIAAPAAFNCAQQSGLLGPQRAHTTSCISGNQAISNPSVHALQVRETWSAVHLALLGTRVQFPPPPLKGHFVNYHKCASLYGLWKQAKPGSAYLHLFARRSQILHRQRYSSSWRSSRSHVSLAARAVGAGERGASSFGVYTDISWQLHWTLSDSRLACHSVPSRASGSSAKVIVLCG